jgi:DNA-binding NarL/FixJ family response regulator
MNTSNRTTVFIAEDSALIRDRLVELLTEIAGVELVGDADTPAAAIAGILRTHPDFAVLDYQLEGGTAVDVLNAVRAKASATTFLVLTNHSGPQYRRVCLEAGASQFFDKSLEFHRVKDAIAATVA